jgi:hypothetical protein
MAYNGIPYLRGPNEAIDYDLTMREELRKCAKSYKYFVENYIKIDDNSGSLKVIQLYDYQKNLLNIVHNNKMTVCKFPRQCGKCLKYNTNLELKNTGEIHKLDESLNRNETITISIGDLFEQAKAAYKKV